MDTARRLNAMLQLGFSLLAAVAAYCLLLGFLAGVRYPWQVLRNPQRQGAPAVLLSFFAHTAIVVALGLLWFGPPVQLLKVAELQAEFTPPEPEIALSTPLVAQQQFDGVNANATSPTALSGGEAVAMLELERPELVVFDAAAGHDSFTMPGPALGRGTTGDTDGKKGKGGSTFYGINAKGNKFVFVMDISGSMEGVRFYRARYELKRAISELADSQQFSIIFFNHMTYSLCEDQLVTATEANLEDAHKWISRAVCIGDTHPLAGLELALKMQPDAIFFLTDGEFPHEAPQVMALQQAVRYPIPIHTICLINRGGEPVLKVVANRTGGLYRFAQ